MDCQLVTLIIIRLIGLVSLPPEVGSADVRLAQLHLPLWQDWKQLGSTSVLLQEVKKTLDQDNTSFKGGDKYRSKKVCPIQVNPHQVGGVQEDRSKALRDDL